MSRPKNKNIGNGYAIDQIRLDFKEANWKGCGVAPPQYYGTRKGGFGHDFHR